MSTTCRRSGSIVSEQPLSKNIKCAQLAYSHWCAYLYVPINFVFSLLCTEHKCLDICKLQLGNFIDLWKQIRLSLCSVSIIVNSHVSHSPDLISSTHPQPRWISVFPYAMATQGNANITCLSIFNQELRKRSVFSVRFLSVWMTLYLAIH